MKLLVRCQSGEAVVTCSNFCIYNERAIYSSNSDIDFCLGVYATKERAKEVFEEMLKTLRKGIKYNGFRQIYPAYYEMPKE